MHVGLFPFPIFKKVVRTVSFNLPFRCLDVILLTKHEWVALEMQFVNSKAHDACTDNYSEIINAQSKHPNAFKDKLMNVRGRNILKHTFVTVHIMSLIFFVMLWSKVRVSTCAHYKPHWVGYFPHQSKTYCGLILNNQQVAVDPYVFITILTLIVY